ncbi:MAG: hypothetical protein Tsb0019_05820 [Roseibium sp.]
MKIDPQETVVFRRSSGRTLLLLSLSMPFVVIGFIAATGVFDAPGSEGAGLVIGLLTIAFFGSLGLLGVLRLVLNPDETIGIGPDGIRDRRIASQVIPWSKIERISVWSSRGSSMVMLELDGDFEATLDQSTLYRLFKSANRLVGATGHCLNPVGFSVPFRDFHGTIIAYAKAHGSPAVAPSPPAPCL